MKFSVNELALYREFLTHHFRRPADGIPLHQGAIDNNLRVLGDLKRNCKNPAIGNLIKERLIQFRGWCKEPNIFADAFKIIEEAEAVDTMMNEFKEIY